MTLFHTPVRPGKTNPLGLAIRVACAVLTGLSLAACQSKGSDSRTDVPEGVYALASVNGQPVPATISHDGASLQIRSGTCTFGPKQSCSTTTVFVPPSGPELSRTASATYSARGADLSLRWKGAGHTSGRVDGATFTLNNEGMVLVYRK